MKSNTPIIQRGFTLVEMMIVVAIVAILAVIALPSYERYIERGDATEAKAEILKVQSILTQERLRNPAHTLSTASGIRTRIAASGASQITLSNNVAEKYELGVGGSDDAPVLTLTPRAQYASSRTLGARVDLFSNAFICADSTATRATTVDSTKCKATATGLN